jgi:alpha-glucosidase
MKFSPLMLLFSLACALPACAAPVTLQSPDGNLVWSLDNPENGNLNYQLRFKNQPVLESSPLGITVDGHNLAQNAILDAVKRREFNENYATRGVHSRAKNHFREAVISLKSGAAWQLEVRAFDDGVAFRYRVPGTGTRQIGGEMTGWQLPAGATIWFQDNKRQDYETRFQSAALEALPQIQPIQAPATLKIPGVGYAMISEANLVGYSDMALQPSGANRFRALFFHDKAGWSHEGEIVSPWRVTLFSPNLNGLVNSDIIRNLCPPPAPELQNAKWIAPGRSTWHWMATRAPKLPAQRQWVDWTSRLGFDYYLIDDGWVRWRAPGKDQWDLLKEVVDYAAPRGVRIWAWVHTKEVTAPADRLAYFKKAKEIGLVGLKIDFMGPPNTTWVNWYEDTLRDAAAAQLMVNFHGALKPTGRERTWPNELTREAIAGRENGKLPGLHDTTLPFVRFVQGHGDYTPTEFDPTKLRGSSWAREMAQAVVYTSPQLCLSGSPELYLKNDALDILKTLPSDWDETIVLPGSEIGQVAGFARRKGREWFVGVVNGASPRTFPISLDFLGNGSYQIAKLADSPERNDTIQAAKGAVTKNDTLSAELRAEGGFVARFRLKTVP